MSAAPTAAPLQSLIGSPILALREQHVMLDYDLADLYGVQTKVLVRAVKRNLARFPADFMCQLSAEEFAALKSQAVTSNAGAPRPMRSPSKAWRCCPRYSLVRAPSPRTSRSCASFVRVRELAITHGNLAKRLNELEENAEALALRHDAFSRNPSQSDQAGLRRHP